MTDIPSKDDLLRYLAGSLTGDAAERVRTYIDASPARQGGLAGLRELLRTEILASGPPTPNDVANARLFRAMDEYMNTSIASAHASAEGEHRRSGLKASAAIAPRRATRSVARWTPAIVGAAVVIGAVALFGIRTIAPDRWVDGRTYATSVGQRATVRLPDGTTVRLGPSTTLMMDARFGDAQRRLRLSGEAFFAVNDAAKAPFQVQTGAVMTRVLGTVFTVRRYPTDSVVQVVVETGRVVTGVTGGKSASVTLAAGDVARVSDSATTVLRGGGPSELVDWSNNMLVFRDTPVPEMLATLERWYGVGFRLMDSSLTVGRVSAEVNVADRDETFKVLQAVLGASLTFDGRVVVLSRRHEVPEVPPVRRVPLPDPVRADRGAGLRNPTREMGR